jgi:hypothetical protein
VAEFNPRGSRVNKDGFFTVEQGIGTARGASPTYKASACLDLEHHDEFPFHLGYTSKVETPIHDSTRELVTWECKEHGVKS